MRENGQHRGKVSENVRDNSNYNLSNEFLFFMYVSNPKPIYFFF